jgi:hypothetical protein
MLKDFFIYGANFLAIAAGITQTNNITIQADSDFELQKLCFASDLNAGVQTDSTRTIPQCTLIILDTGSGRQLMNQGIDLTTFFGNGSEPFILPTPKKFRANTALSLALTNYSVAQTYNVRLSLIGMKVFG